MALKIVGIVWFLLGLLWLAKPAMLQNSIKKKANKKIKKLIAGVILLMGLSLVGTVFSFPGIISKIIAVVGLSMVIKAIMLLTSKTSEKLIEWFENRSIKIFRVIGLAVCIMGAVLFVVK